MKKKEQESAGAQMDATLKLTNEFISTALAALCIKSTLRELEFHKKTVSFTFTLTGKDKRSLLLPAVIRRLCDDVKTVAVPRNTDLPGYPTPNPWFVDYHVVVSYDCEVDVCTWLRVKYAEGSLVSYEG